MQGYLVHLPNNALVHVCLQINYALSIKPKISEQQSSTRVYPKLIQPHTLQTRQVVKSIQYHLIISCNIARNSLYLIYINIGLMRQSSGQLKRNEIGVTIISTSKGSKTSGANLCGRSGSKCKCSIESHV